MQVASQARQQSSIEKPVSSEGIVPAFLRKQLQAQKGAVEQNRLLKSGQNCFGLTQQERYICTYAGVLHIHAPSFPQT